MTAPYWTPLWANLAAFALFLIGYVASRLARSSDRRHGVAAGLISVPRLARGAPLLDDATLNAAAWRHAWRAGLARQITFVFFALGGWVMGRFL